MSAVASPPTLLLLGSDMPDEAPGQIALTITGKDIWEKLTSIEQNTSGLPAIVADHEVRIRLLEQSKWKLAGLAIALGGGAGGAIAKLLGVV